MRRFDDRDSFLQQRARVAYETWTMIYDSPKTFVAYLGELLCRIGSHDLRLIEVVGGFGVGGPVEKFKCARCGKVVTRRGV